MTRPETRTARAHRPRRVGRCPEYSGCTPATPPRSAPSELSNRACFAASVPDRGDEFCRRFADWYTAPLAEQEAGAAPSTFSPLRTARCWAGSTYVLTGIFPALEAAFDHSDHKGALTLLTGYQTPAAIRRRGLTRLTTRLTRRNVRSPATVAHTAVQAAEAQHTTLPGQQVAADIVADIAQQILDLDERLKRIDNQIRCTFCSHPQAAVIESLPGMGPILGAEFIVAAGDLTSYANEGHLASAAGLVPVPRDSGRRTGNLHRPQRYSRRLRRVLYLSAQTSIIRDGPTRDYYLKKRAEGARHVQAVIALARRRVAVLWALLRDNRPFTTTPPTTAAA